MSEGSVASPGGASNCSPDVEIATASEFRLVNRNKPNNFVWGELVQGILTFLVENEPKDGTGCPGRWMFAEMMRHFGGNVTAIRGSWTYGDNLAIVNQLTAGSAVSVAEAAESTWTGKRAAEYGYSQIEVTTTTGLPGGYSNIQVLFKQ